MGKELLEGLTSRPVRRTLEVWEGAPAASSVGMHRCSFLGERVERAREGARATVLLEADAGIGKSRLVTETLARFRDPKDAVALGHGMELAGGELPYGTVIDSLRGLVLDAGTEAVRVAAGGDVSTLAVLCPALGSPEPSADRSRLLPAFASAIAAMALDRLMWLIVEDLHWADASSRDLLNYVLRVTPPCRCSPWSRCAPTTRS